MGGGGCIPKTYSITGMVGNNFIIIRNCGNWFSRSNRIPSMYMSVITFGTTNDPKMCLFERNNIDDINVFCNQKRIGYVTELNFAFEILFRLMFGLNPTLNRA